MSGQSYFYVTLGNSFRNSVATHWFWLYDVVPSKQFVCSRNTL